MVRISRVEEVHTHQFDELAVYHDRGGDGPFVDVFSIYNSLPPLLVQHNSNTSQISDFLVSTFQSGIAIYAVRRSGAFCVRVLCRIFALEEGATVPCRFGFVRGCLELAAACVTMVRASTCSMGFFSSLQVWIYGFSIVCEEVWLISAEAAAAWSCPEFHLLSLGRALAVDEVLHLVLVSFVICATWSLGTTTLSKGSSCAATTAATPRVDVEKTPQAAAAPKYLLASSGHVWTEFGGLLGPSEKFQRVEVEGKHGGGKREKMDSFVVFVVSLGGSTVQVRVEGKNSYESLAAKVAAKVNIPACHWYLTFWGRDLRHMLCPPSVLHRDSTVVMQSRLLGGAPL